MVTDERVDVDWNEELVEQLDLHGNVWFLPRLQGLTDDEYLWEPVEGRWSVRPGDDGVRRMDAYVRSRRGALRAASHGGTRPPHQPRGDPPRRRSVACLRDLYLHRARAISA